MKSLSLNLWFILSIFFSIHLIQAQVPESDSLALVDIYNATDGDNWAYSTNWLEGPVSTWLRVTVQNNRVTQLEFSGNNLSGDSIPASIGDLDALEYLSFASNPNLTAPIPPEIGLLKKLVTFDIGLSNFTGSIPPQISGCDSLTTLKLYDNNLTGEIPAEIGELSSLSYINLNYNSFDGYLPESLGNLGNMRLFRALSNNFKGAVPENISNWTKIEEILLRYNDLVDFPDLSATTSLLKLDLIGNRLTFEDLEYNMGVAANEFVYTPQDSVGISYTDIVHHGNDISLSVTVGGSANNYQWMKDGLDIPLATDSIYVITSAEFDDAGEYNCRVTNDIVPYLEIFSREIEIEVIDYAAIQDSLALVALYQSTGGATNWTHSTNWLTTPLSEGWYGITMEDRRVKQIELSSNGLTGTLPEEIGNLDSLQELNLGYNNISGSLPHEFWNLINLRGIELTSNNFSDTLSEAIGNLTGLRNINLSYNSFSGNFPQSITDLTQLQMLDLYSNQLMGELPVSIGNLDSLYYLDLGSNELTGSIPSSIGNLKLLKSIRMYSNNLTGTVPPEIGNLSLLQELNLNSNNLSGGIPESIYDLGNLYYLGFGYNYNFGDSLSAKISSMSGLSQIFLPGCNFSGPLPQQIGSFEKMTHINLSGNSFYGPIPESIGNYTNLSWLYLGSNELTGEIPASISNLTNLTYLGLESNDFGGTIPEYIWDLTNLKSLRMSNNNWSQEFPQQIINLSDLTFLDLSNNLFSGAVPEQINQLTELMYFYIENNQLSDFPSLDSLTNLKGLKIERNKLTFEDIEPNLGRAASFYYYSPQDSVGCGQDTLLAAGDDLVLSVSVGGDYNLYQWYLNDKMIDNASQNTYTIDAASAVDSGVYICEITNTQAIELSLYSRAKKVHVKTDVHIGDELSVLPDEFRLEQNYPNPFNPVTKINYQLKETSYVQLAVYDVRGQRVKTLVCKKQDRGSYSIKFKSAGLASGVYYYRIQAGKYCKIRKMILLR